MKNVRLVVLLVFAVSVAVALYGAAFDNLIWPTFDTFIWPTLRPLFCSFFRG